MYFYKKLIVKKILKKTFNSSWDGKAIHCFIDSPHRRGVCILIRNNLNIEIIDTHCSADGRILLLNVKLFDEYLSLVNIYAPNRESLRKTFFCKVEKYINQYANQNNTILSGDFNCCLNENDRIPQTH